MASPNNGSYSFDHLGVDKMLSIFVYHTSNCGSFPLKVGKRSEIPDSDDFCSKYAACACATETCALDAEMSSLRSMSVWVGCGVLTKGV